MRSLAGIATIKDIQVWFGSDVWVLALLLSEML